MAGSGSALIAAQPTRSNICGCPLVPNTSERTASRVSEISRGSVTGQVASPIAVADSSTRLVASPARSRARSSSVSVPSASMTPLSSAAEVCEGCLRAGPANTRAGNIERVSVGGVLRAGTPATEPYRPLHALSSVR